MVWGDAVSTLATFVWILNDVSRSITSSLFTLKESGSASNMDVLFGCCRRHRDASYF